MSRIEFGRTDSLIRNTVTTDTDSIDGIATRRISDLAEVNAGDGIPGRTGGLHKIRRETWIVIEVRVIRVRILRSQRTVAVHRAAGNRNAISTVVACLNAEVGNARYYLPRRAPERSAEDSAARVNGIGHRACRSEANGTSSSQITTKFATSSVKDAADKTKYSLAKIYDATKEPGIVSDIRRSSSRSREEEASCQCGSAAL